MNKELEEYPVIFAEGEKYHSLGQRPRKTKYTHHALLWLKAKHIISGASPRTYIDNVRDCNLSIS